MRTLQETLAELSRSLPELPARLEQLVSDGKQTDQAAAELLEDVASKHGEAAQHLAELQQALEQIASASDESATRLETGVDSVESESDQALGALRTQGTGVDASATTAETALGELEHALAEVGQEAATAGQQIQQGLERLGRVLSDGQKDVSEAATSADDEMRALDAAFDEVRAAVADGTSALGEALQVFVEHAKARLGTTVGSFQALCESLKAAIPEQESELVTLADDVEEEARAVLEQELRQKAAEAAAGVGTALAGLGQALAQATNDARAHKEVLGQRVAELSHVTEPLPEALSKLKAAVQSAGLTWG